MEIQEFLKDKTIIICPYDYKEKILFYLSNNKLIYDLKFMTLNEYQKNYFFDYDINAIKYLVDNYHLQVANAINYLDNLIYIEDKIYHNEKLDYLVKLKKELNEKDLLIYNPLFKKEIENKNIIIYGYGELDNFTKKMFNNPKVIVDKKRNVHYDVYEFNDIVDEVEYIFNNIALLLQKGININNIKIMNANSEYYPLFKRFSSFYEIPFDDMNEDTLISTKLGKNFYLNILNGFNHEKLYEYLNNYQDSPYYKSLINLLNKYCSYELSDVKELILYDLERISLKKEYSDVIKLVDINSYINPDDYVFLISFNNNLIPKFKSDITYITDNIKDLVRLDKTVYLNILIKENTLNKISNINNLYISYKNNTPFNSYYPSNLLDEMDYEIKKYETSFNYSDSLNKMKYTYLLDNYHKYGLNSININDFNKLYSKYQDINYNTYNNNFTGLSKDKFLNFINNNLTLSYSNIDTYYKCSFKYYLENILKINVYEETFSAVIGSLFHYVLRKYREKDFDLDKEYNNFLKDKTFNNKEKFFLDKLKSDLSYVIEVINNYNLITGFNDELYEQEIILSLREFPKVSFKGFIDKIMYKENNNETLLSIIDYKTGNIDIKMQYLPFGLSMQLPTYLYLMKNSHLFNNIKFTGFYLQHILDNEIKIDNKKSFDEIKKDNLKLTGYSTSDLNRLAKFDSTYEKSEMIHGLKLNKDGSLPKNNKCVSDNEIDDIINLTSSNINKAMDNILEADFNINPKIINDLNMSCNFCKYKDICYKKEKDNIYLKVEGEDYGDNVDE